MIINPLIEKDYDQIIAGHPASTFFHTSAWARVLAESYGYRPRYFSIRRNDSFEVLIPIMEIDSVLTGKRGVSLPFTDFISPLLTSHWDLRRVWGSLVVQARRFGWRCVELRGASGSDLPASESYQGHILDLGRDLQFIEASFRDSTRRNVTKASRSGVTVRISSSADALAEFCRLNCLSRRDHGLPPQPAVFFRKLHEHVLACGNGFVAIAEHEGRPVAGAVFLHFGGKAIYKYGASDRSMRHLRANNLVMAEAIRHCKYMGMESLCLGRTDADHSGLLQFKAGWGCVEKKIDYSRYDLKRGEFTAGGSAGVGAAARLFRILPLPVLRVCGEKLYRHAG